jgi:hypothetical protein
MDDRATLEALRTWLLTDDTAQSFIKTSAVRAYQMMASCFSARLGEGRFVDAAAAHAFAANVEQAIRSDVHHGADEEDGEAMLAFWANVVAFLEEHAPRPEPR